MEGYTRTTEEGEVIDSPQPHFNVEESPFHGRTHRLVGK